MDSFCLPSLGKHSRSRSAPGTYLVLTAFSLVSLLHGQKVFEFYFFGGFKCLSFLSQFLEYCLAY